LANLAKLILFLDLLHIQLKNLPQWFAGSNKALFFPATLKFNLAPSCSMPFTSTTGHSGPFYFTIFSHGHRALAYAYSACIFDTYFIIEYS